MVKISKGKIVMILLLVLSAGIFSWAATNYTQLADFSMLFFAFSMLSLIVIGLDLVVDSGKIEFIETWTWEESWWSKSGKVVKVASFIIILLVSGFYYYKAKGGFQTFSAPAYSISASPVLNALLSALVSIPENTIFLGILPVILGYSIFYKLIYNTTENESLSNIIGGIMYIIFAVGIWIIYHWSRYGLVDVDATLSVAFFAFITSLWVVMTRNLLMPHVIHFIVIVVCVILYFAYRTPKRRKK